MAETVLCDNCGAPLAPDDGFCGECGAPRPTLAPGSAPTGTEVAPLSVEAAAEPSPLPAPPSPPRAPAEGGRIAAKVIAIVLAVVSVGLCGLGLLITLAIPLEDLTMQDRLIGSAVLCFCPGVLALALALILWLVAVRRKQATVGEVARSGDRPQRG